MESYLLQVWKLKFNQVGSKGKIWTQIYSSKISAQFTETIDDSSGWNYLERLQRT